MRTRKTEGSNEREYLYHLIETLPEDSYPDVIKYIRYIKYLYSIAPGGDQDLSAKHLMIASEAVLAREWNDPEEDEAWSDLL